MSDIEKKLFGRKLYAIKFPDEEESSEIVLNVEFWNDPPTEHSNGFKGICYLTPPERGHMIRGEIIEEHEWGFIFHSDGAFEGNWTFTEVTLDSFIEVYGECVMGSSHIASQVANTKELQDWFYKEFLGE